MKKLLVTLDGGGVRGLWTLRLLDRIQEELKIELATHTHAWAGTSAGGLSALGIAHGWPIHELLEITQMSLPAVFEDSTWDDIKDLGRVGGAEYGTKGLAQLCRTLLGDKHLCDLEGTVIIPTTLLDDKYAAPRRWRMKVYHNIPGEAPETQMTAVDIGIATSAAPTYFPSWHGHVDGGLVANNPCMTAVGAVLDSRNQQPLALEDIAVLSVGSGIVPRYIAGTKKRDWGYSQWSSKIIPLILETQVGKDAFTCQQILGESFFRLNEELPKAWSLDSLAAVDDLLEHAEQVDLSGVLGWLTEVLQLT